VCTEVGWRSNPWSWASYSGSPGLVPADGIPTQWLRCERIRPSWMLSMILAMTGSEVCCFGCGEVTQLQDGRQMMVLVCGKLAGRKTGEKWRPFSSVRSSVPLNEICRLNSHLSIHETIDLRCFYRAPSRVRFRFWEAGFDP